MKYPVKYSNPLNQASDCIAVTIYQGGTLGALASEVDAATGGAIGRVLKRDTFKANAGDVLLLPDVDGIKAGQTLLVGAGKRDGERDLKSIRKIGAAVAAALDKAGVGEAVLDTEGLTSDRHSNADSIAALVESMEYAIYRFDRLKEEKKPARLRSIQLHCGTRALAGSAQNGVDRGQAVAHGVVLARDLGNLPGNLCTPNHLATEARKLQRSHGLKVSVLDEARMKKLGMGALLSVSRGSREPARLIIMEYHGAAKSSSPVVLVGKGLTFDAGGISLKPAAAMDEMKYDMCGGASVFGTMVAVSELGLPVNLIGIVPASENLPDGAANKPGDIVTSMAGKTIEILNTDAEGRLILCDALTYARRYKPAVVVDIATLTGACVVALGAHASGLFTPDDELASALVEAGEHAADRAWRMPVWDDYQEQLDSPFADMANVGGRNAGAVTAACFLARFTKDLRWAHLDIAGTAWTSGKNKSATGRPVGLLTRFVMNHCR